MENINSYTDACRTLGVPEADLFDTVGPDPNPNPIPSPSRNPNLFAGLGLFGFGPGLA